MLFAFTVTTYVANILIAVAFSRLRVVNPKPSDVTLSVIALSYWTTTVLGRSRCMILCAELKSSFSKCSASFSVIRLFFSHNANANRLVFIVLTQIGKLYTLSILRTLNAKVKL
ncbi:hypothetical protein EDB19DRAFT_1823051 [Suillus lakei]|nr:hypothetical protein EDB19DRAFT_1837411 [Suillus lakei]KAG1755460.1 hypothetical protein EDB19DRAFT_1823051 [Suillus lakei]